MSCWRGSRAILRRCARRRRRSSASSIEFEYYRRFVICVKARMQRTMQANEHALAAGSAVPVMPYTLAQGQEKLAQVLPAYCSAEEFLDDLECAAGSLASNRGLRIARTLVDPLLLQVRTFGLHLHTLDIRQHAQRARARRSKEAIADTMARFAAGVAVRETASVLETFRVVAEVKAGCSPEAIRQYVISGAASVEDVLAVVRLARLGGVTRGRNAGTRSGPDAGAAVRVD